MFKKREHQSRKSIIESSIPDTSHRRCRYLNDRTLFMRVGYIIINPVYQKDLFVMWGENHVIHSETLFDLAMASTTERFLAVVLWF